MDSNASPDEADEDADVASPRGPRGGRSKRERRADVLKQPAVSCKYTTASGVYDTLVNYFAASKYIGDTDLLKYLPQGTFRM